MSKSSSSKLAGWRLVWGDISFFMSDDRSESGPWKLVWVIILLNFLFHPPQIIYHWSSNHAQPQTFVHLEEFLVFLAGSVQPSSEHNPNMFPTTPADSLLINYLIVYEQSASSGGLWSDPTRQTCTIDFNFNFVQNSTQSFILNCMIEFLDWASLAHPTIPSSSSSSSGRRAQKARFPNFLCIVFNLQYQYIFPQLSIPKRHHPQYKSEMKNNKIVNRTAQWKYLNKILNIQTLTSKLYRKWYYVESWIINLTLNYNQVNHYLKLRNEAQLFQ